MAIKEKITVQFKQWNCILKWGEYGNGRAALQLMDADVGDLVMTATVNLPEEDLEDNEVFIKDYSENDGILEVLVNAGIIEDTGRRVQTGFVTIPVCRVLKKKG